MSTSILSGLGSAFKGLWWFLDATRRSLLNLLLLVLLGALVWALLKPGAPALQPKTALVLDLAGPVVEQRTGSARDARSSSCRAKTTTRPGCATCWPCWTPPPRMKTSPMRS
jgi:hypothetical protein